MEYKEATPIWAINTVTGEKRFFESQMKASYALNLKYEKVNQCANGHKRTYHDWMFIKDGNEIPETLVYSDQQEALF